MNFYNSTHRHYCGIDLHARILYVCILDQQGETLLHKEIPAKPEHLLRLIEPYLDDLVIVTGHSRTLLTHPLPADQFTS